MFRLLGLFAIIPTTTLLTISFFVLFAIRKAEVEGLKAFGYVIAALLWGSALLIFLTGAYIIFTGRTPMGGMMMQKMLMGKMGCHMKQADTQGIMRGMMPGGMGDDAGMRQGK